MSASLCHPPAVAALPAVGDRILRPREVAERVGLGIATIYRRVEEGVFPKQVKLGPNSVGWRESDISRWIADLPVVGCEPPRMPVGNRGQKSRRR